MQEAQGWTRWLNSGEKSFLHLSEVRGHITFGSLSHTAKGLNGQTFVTSAYEQWPHTPGFHAGNVGGRPDMPWFFTDFVQPWQTRILDGSLPSGQERVSPPSRLQKAISPKVTISHEAPLQSKTHEQCRKKRCVDVDGCFTPGISKGGLTLSWIRTLLDLWKYSKRCQFTAYKSGTKVTVCMKHVYLCIYN